MTKTTQASGSMTYEQHLDEVCTLITEKYDIADEAAIKMVMRAQAEDFFCGHDDEPSICTLDRAHLDAKAISRKYK
jgi:hypothetical protein